MNKAEIRHIRLDSLNADPAYQRPLNPSRLREGGDLHPFRPEAFGVGAASERDDTTLWVMDGQHRAESGRAAGQGAETFPFLVYIGLTLADEATMFRHLNNFRQVSPTDRFRARVIEGDPAAVALQTVMTKHGWRLGGAAHAGSIAAIATLEKVYGGMKIRPEGGQLAVCDSAISILTAAYGHNTHAVKGELIAGLGLFLLRHREHVDTAKIVNELGKIEGGALGLIGRAKALKELRGGNVGNAMAEIITNLHNKNRRTRILPDWNRA